MNEVVPEPPVLEACGLSKSYRRRGLQDRAHALLDFNVELAAGRCLLLIGHNGAGKSTALRLIAGIERPSSGQVRCFGRAPSAMECRRRIGYLADGSELFPFLDVHETLAFFASASNLSRAEARTRAEEMIEIFGLASFAKKRVRSYSLGMRRRLGLAAVLMGSPDLLLLDEPSAGLDPAGGRLLNERLLEERRRGAAIVLSSHQLGHADSVADEVIVLREGRIWHRGPSEALAERIGRRDVDLSGLDDQAIDELEAFVASKGGRVLGSRVSERGLEDELLGDRETT